MNIPHSAPDPVTALIDEEARSLRDFLVLLGRERDALAANEVDSLLALAQEKEAACAQINRISIGRARALASAGVAREKTAIESYLAGRSQAGLRAWHEILDLANRVRDLNRENGLMITTQLRHHQQALAVLLAAADRAALYGPDGQAQASPASRHYGSA